MDLRNQAGQLAKKGRNGDSMLMHVTPSEVAGMDKLAHQLGTQMTYNPKTGLPEASFLSHLGDVVSNIVSHPLPALENLALVYMGVDPVTAGAITGGTNAAVSGGNVLKGAITGGVSGYVGGEAGDLAGASGIGGIGSSAIGGAAGGATGALLSGQNPVTGAFTGALAGSVLSTVMQGTNTQVNFDDGSNLTYDQNGKLVNGTQSDGTPIAQASINQANSQGATVETATPATPEQIKGMSDIVTATQNSGGTQGDVYNALKAAGYSDDIMNASFGKDTVTSFQQAAVTQNNAISKIIADGQAANLTNDQIATSLSKAGYNANQTIAVTGADTADQINQLFKGVNSGQPVSPVNSNQPTNTTNGSEPVSTVAGGLDNPVYHGVGLSNEDAQNITDIIQHAQDNQLDATAMAKELKAQGYTAQQVIDVVGPGNADAVNNAFTSIGGTTPVAPVKPTDTTNTTNTAPTGGGQDLTYTTSMDSNGNTTYHYSDGSTLVVDSNGDPIHSTDTTGQTYVSGSNPGLTTTTGGTTPGDTTPGGTTPGGTTPGGVTVIPSNPVVVPVIPTGGGTTTGGGTNNTSNTTNTTPVQFGKVASLVNPGANPGWMGQAVKPMYQTTNPNQAQYYWGAHPYADQNATLDNYNYNAVPNAPTTPWGAASSAVGGTQHLDIPAFAANPLSTGPAIPPVPANNQYTWLQSGAVAPAQPVAVP